MSARERVDARGGLIEDEQVRIVDQRAAQAELLLHAAGELAGRPAFERVEARRLEQFIDATSALCLRLTEQSPMKIDVLKDAERRIKVAAKALRHIGDERTMCGAVRSVSHVALKDHDMALLNDPNAPDQRQQSRFADTVRTDHADHAAGGDLDGHIVERNPFSVAMGNVLDLGDDAIRH